MARRDLVVGLGAGLIAGASIAAFSGGHGTPRAMGQEPPAAAAGRYQVSAWAYPGGGPGPGTPSHGAYVLDTQSGQLWLTIDGRMTRKIEKVE
jgi:hypothetical protein